MKPGPRPTPRNLRVVKGMKDLPGAATSDKPEVPEPPVSIPDPPEHLSADEQGAFLETARRLARMRVMTEADVDALSIYAVNFARWKYATQQVRETGMIVKSPKNYPIQNPFLSIANKSEKVCLDVLREFGLTPSSRTRVRAP